MRINMLATIVIIKGLRLRFDGISRKNLLAFIGSFPLTNAFKSITNRIFFVMNC